MPCFHFFFIGTIINHLEIKKQNKKQKLFFKIIHFFNLSIIEAIKLSLTKQQINI